MNARVGVAVLVAWILGGSAAGQGLVGLSIPEGSMDSSCEPRDSWVWSVAGAPPPNDIGIGYLVNPDPFAGAFVLHDHVYDEDHVPDPARAVVTFEFGSPVRLEAIDVVQHTNGLTLLEAFVGDDLQSLASIASVFGPFGDVTGWHVFAEYDLQRFEFPPAAAGRFLVVVIRKTSLHDGYASYRMFPIVSPACGADCEGDGDLDVFDYLCFLGRYAVQDPYADCEGDGDWDVFDFLCFQGLFAAGC